MVEGFLGERGPGCRPATVDWPRARTSGSSEGADDSPDGPGSSGTFSVEVGGRYEFGPSAAAAPE